MVSSKFGHQKREKFEKKILPVNFFQIFHDWWFGIKERQRCIVHLFRTNGQYAAGAPFFFFGCPNLDERRVNPDSKVQHI